MCKVCIAAEIPPVGAAPVHLLTIHISFANKHFASGTPPLPKKHCGSCRGGTGSPTTGGLAVGKPAQSDITATGSHRL